MPRITELTADSPYFDETIKMLWSRWGDEHNLNFFSDMVTHACLPDILLPKFYICVKNNNLVGTCALLRYDLISRQDLSPWLAYLYVVPCERIRGIGTVLQDHVVGVAKAKGFDRVYLSTELNGYYERSNWRHFGQGYLYTGQLVKYYVKQ